LAFIDQLFLSSAPGEPSTSIYQDYPQATTLEALGVTDIEIIDGTEEGREQVLSEKDLLKVQTQLPANVVVCGMAYAMQAQICSNILKTSGEKAYSMAFYDSFSLWSNTSVAAVYFTNPTPEAVANVMVSADDQRVSLTTPPDAVSPHCTVSLTGNPTLQSWAAVDADESKKQTTRALLYGVGNTNVIGIVFAGGYGDNEYVNSLEIFCSTTKQLCADHACGQASHKTNNNEERIYSFVFSPHPGYSSSFEAKLFRDWGCADHILILPEKLSISTAELITSSNVSVSQCSTVGGQSLSVGVAHAYLTEVNGCEDVFTASSLIPIASTSDDFVYLLLESDSFRGPDEDYTVDSAAVVAAGVPVNGTENIVSEINSHL